MTGVGLGPGQTGVQRCAKMIVCRLDSFRNGPPRPIPHHTPRRYRGKTKVAARIWGPNFEGRSSDPPRAAPKPPSRPFLALLLHTLRRHIERQQVLSLHYRKYRWPKSLKVELFLVMSKDRTGAHDHGPNPKWAPGPNPTMYLTPQKCTKTRGFMSNSLRSW